MENLFADQIVVLGTPYRIKMRAYGDDPGFKECGCNGYCSTSKKKIVICDMETYPDWETEDIVACYKEMRVRLRHEIVHAFLYESGLSSNSKTSDSWAQNEEMIDWFAIQGPKIYAAWAAAGCLSSKFPSTN